MNPGKSAVLETPPFNGLRSRSRSPPHLRLDLHIANPAVEFPRATMSDQQSTYTKGESREHLWFVPFSPFLRDLSTNTSNTIKISSGPGERGTLASILSLSRPFWNTLAPPCWRTYPSPPILPPSPKTTLPTLRTSPWFVCRRLGIALPPATFR